MMKVRFFLLLLSSLALLSCSSSQVAENGEQKQDGAQASTASGSTPVPQDENGAELDSSASAPNSVVNPANLEAKSKEEFTQFLAARKRHDSAMANQLAGEILSRNPNDTRVLNILAVMAIEEEKYDLARLFIDKVLAKDQNNGTALNNLGVIELKTDNLRLALIQFKKASAFDPKNKAAHANLGSIYLKYRNYQNAAQELGDAVENGDQGPDTLSNLGFAQTGIGDFGAATKSYERAIAKDSNNTTILLNYSALLVEKLHRYKDAIKLLNKIRFIAREPAILDKVEILLKKAENPVPKNGEKTGEKSGSNPGANNIDTEKGVSANEASR
jgi:Flp pilus assembly protein TadD